MTSFTNSAPVGGATTDGLFQVGGYFNYQTGHGTLTNNLGATFVAGSGMLIEGDALTNHGVFQTATSATITTNNDVTNDGTIYFTSHPGYVAQVYASDIINSGTIDAYSGLLLNAYSALTNTSTGVIAANDVLELTSNHGTIGNSGLFSAVGNIYVSGATSFTATGKAVGTQYNQTSGSLDLQDDGTNGASIDATSSFTINVSTLTLDGQHARILGSTGAAGNSSIDVANGLTVNGLIFSGDTLSVTSDTGDILLPATGAISAGNGLTVAATHGNTSPTSANSTRGTP